VTSIRAPRDSEGSGRLTDAQTRTARVALDLFGTHGVSGTSLQMIADELGVTKAAVYHQFHTKEEIVVAAVESELTRFEDALAAAEATGPGPEALDALLRQVIELAVARHRLVGTLQHDPAIARLLAERAPFQDFVQRLSRALLGGRHGTEARVRAAMIASAIGGAVTHPLVAGLDDRTLAAQLLRQTRRFLELPPRGPRTSD
jgi:AcrR family transcriptional regulator